MTNNGIAHQQQVPTAQIGQLLQDTLDAIEYIMGPSDSTWGGLRAAMGHEKAWNMTYFGVGNEASAVHLTRRSSLLVTRGSLRRIGRPAMAADRRLSA